MKGMLFNLLQDVVISNDATKRSVLEYI